MSRQGFHLHCQKLGVSAIRSKEMLEIKKEQIVKELLKGKSACKIASDLKISVQTVYRVTRRYKAAQK